MGRATAQNGGNVVRTKDELLHLCMGLFCDQAARGDSTGFNLSTLKGKIRAKYNKRVSETAWGEVN